MNVLFINHKIANCGVYQYGKRLYDILKTDENINYIYNEIDSYEEYIALLTLDYVAIIYNYHCSTIPWLNHANIQRRVKNIGIPHESAMDMFDIICNIDPTIQETYNHYALPRPIYENYINSMCEDDTNEKQFINAYKDSGLPIFGSFGFGFDNKGFDRIIRTVNEQYDHAIIKFVIPIAYYDPDPMRVHKMKQICMNTNKKEGIIVMITHDFFTNEDLLRFLKSNTMNIFLYDYMGGRGISSTIDYALSVKVPLGISDSFMFRNIYSDKICIYKRPICEIMEESVGYCDNFLKLYSHENVRKKIRQIFIDHNLR
jgi:hypothetical protein